MQTYGFDRIKLVKMDKDLNPIKGSIQVVEGKPKEGATASFEVTGLAKEPVKVYGSNLAYFTARKGHGSIAVNLGLLDLPAKIEHEILGHTVAENGVAHLGPESEPPYYALLIESKNLHNEQVGFGMYIGSFNTDGFSGETITDEDFTPEPGEYVFTPISKRLPNIEAPVTIGYADDTESFKELEKELFGSEETTQPETEDKVKYSPKSKKIENK